MPLPKHFTEHARRQALNDEFHARPPVPLHSPQLISYVAMHHEGEAPGAAVLSLGFSLRLVDSLARGSGGRLDIGHNALTLHLPSANSKAEVELEVQQGE